MPTSFRYHRSYRGPVRGVVLDWAGTIVDHGSLAPVAAFVEVFRREDVDVTHEEVRAFMGTSKRDHLRALTRVPRVASAWAVRHGRPPGEEDVDRMYHAFSPIQIDLLPRHADPIPGCLEALADLRQRNVRIGSNSGYSGPMMEVLLIEAARRGLEVDAVACADDVPAGRPAPWMALEVARRLGIYPMESLVKVDDTVAGVEEGLNAGMWAVGVARTGNELGLSLDETEALPLAELSSRVAAGASRLARAGAHFVVGSVADLPACLDSINRLIAAGERP
jgi:phosphonoacetaldehyde hydrolase